jgi:hypothetical protein
LILPALAYADKDGKDKDKGKDHGDKDIPIVPEANAAWVLVLFLVQSCCSLRDGSSMPIWLKNNGSQFIPVMYAPRETSPTWR